MKRLAILVVVASCLPRQPPAPPSPPPEQLAATRHEEAARRAGYPTRKSPADLETAIAKFTKDKKLASKEPSVQLDAPAPITFAAERGACYAVVMRLADGAAWGPGAEAGFLFEAHSPWGEITSGPGPIGPGAIAGLGCATASGTVTLTMPPRRNHDPMGTGALSVEVWSHVVTAHEAAQRQAEQQRAAPGCAACAARYQGCIGAGGSRNDCTNKYSSCALEKVGYNFVSFCSSPD